MTGRPGEGEGEQRRKIFGEGKSDEGQINSGRGRVKIDAYIRCTYIEVDLSKIDGLNYSVQTELFF